MDGTTPSNAITGRSYWLSSGTSAIGGGSYTWTTNGIPTNWGNSNYVPPTRVFLLSFTNEAKQSYQLNNCPPSFAYTSGGQTEEPSNTYISDFNEFTGSLSSMDYFGAILYPVVGTNAGGFDSEAQNMLLQSYAAINPLSEIIGTDFETAITTPSYTATGCGSSLQSIFSGGNVTNPYYNNNGVNRTLSQYGWNGVFNKNNQPSGALNFTDVEFANDINGILDASGGLSEANVVSSYTNGVLTIRGFQSSTIDFSITDDDCILMETNGSGGTGGSGTSGSSGSSGTSGIAGSSGPAGTSGTSGTSGVAGSSGPAGTSGSSGSSGTSGVAGSSGPAGTSGSSGTSGTSGVAGSSGPAGTSGSSGTSGTSGVAGSSGTSGTSSTGGTTSVIASSSGGLAVTTANNQAVISLDICSNLDEDDNIQNGDFLAFCDIDAAPSSREKKVSLENLRRLEDSFSATNNFSGTIITLISDEANGISVGSGVAISRVTAGRVLLARSIISSTQVPCIGIAVTAANKANDPIDILLMGVAEYQSYPFTSSDIGKQVFLNTTQGTFSVIAPSVPGQQIQVVGVVLGADKMLFNPSFDYITI